MNTISSYAGMVAAAAMFAAAEAVYAVDYIKANNANNLNLASSYTNNSGVPGSADRIVVSAAMSTGRSVLLGQNMSIAGIVVDATATQTLNIKAGNTLEIGSDGVQLLPTTGPNLDFACEVKLGAGQTWAAGGRSLTFSGAGTINENGQSLIITGTNIFGFNSSTAQTLNADIRASTFNVTGGTAGLTLTNSNSSFGAIAINNGGTVIAAGLSNAGSNSPMGKGTIQLGSSTNGTFRYTGTTASYSQAFAHDARAVVSAVEVSTAGQTLTLTSNMATTSTANSAVGNGWVFGGAGNVTLSGIVSDSTHATRTGTTVTKTGLGTLRLSAVNTYTGATTISGGSLVLEGAGRINGSSGVAVAAGGTFTNDSTTAYNKAMSLAEGAVLSGTGSFAPTSVSITGDLSGGAFTSFAMGAASFAKAGALTLTLSNVQQNSYTLFSGTAVTGAFSSVSVNGTPLNSLGGGNFGGTVDGATYQFTNDTSSLLISIPEPAAMGLVSLGGMLCVMTRRRQA